MNFTVVWLRVYFGCGVGAQGAFGSSFLLFFFNVRLCCLDTSRKAQLPNDLSLSKEQELSIVVELNEDIHSLFGRHCCYICSFLTPETLCVGLSRWIKLLYKIKFRYILQCTSA